jgi:toxin FitB
MFLLDTNVLSNAVSRAPSERVTAWLQAQRETQLFVSVLTIAEIEFGIAKLSQSRRLQRLLVWRAALLEAFESRILPLDLEVGLAWGQLRAQADLERRTMPVIDAALAATADVHGLTLVTRNTRDFEAWSGVTFNPWA